MRNSPCGPLRTVEKVTLSASILPSAICTSPKFAVVTVPVKLLPSTLNTNVLSILPFGVSKLAFQVPVASAANASRAKSANTTVINVFIFMELSFGIVSHGWSPLARAASRGRLTRRNINVASGLQRCNPEPRYTFQEAANEKTATDGHGAPGHPLDSLRAGWGICFGALRATSAAALRHRRGRAGSGLCVGRRFLGSSRRPLVLGQRPLDASPARPSCLGPERVA